MKKETNKQFPFKIGNLYEYIGDDCEDFYRGGFYRYAGENCFETLRQELIQFKDEWSEDDPLQGSFKYVAS